MTTRRRVLQGLAGVAAAMALPRYAFAGGWPERPIKMIVPFAPGGNTDGIARIIGNYLSEKLGETFVVDNRPGAGGIVAADALAKASPDGYTMLMVALPQVAIVPVLHKVHYDPVKDFAPICDVASNPFCLVANRDFEAKDIKQFIEYVKARPGKVPYASGGTGSVSHLTMVLFLQRAGLDMVHVPYKGGAPAIADVIAGQVPVYFGNLSEALPHAGRDLNALAVSGAKRSGKLPNVPTIAEVGYPGFKSETWNGVVAPAGTPQEIVDKVATAIQAAVKEKSILDRFDTYGVDAIGAGPAEFKAIMLDDIAKWKSAISAAKITL
jgi:tripartite-type tricarboxylate transporter receptor subunit TctC